MKISLNTVLTLMTFAAWFLGLAQLPMRYKSDFVAISFVFVMLMMLIVATTSSVNKDGGLDYEKNSVHAVFGSTFKMAALIVLILFIVVTIVVPATAFLLELF